MVNVMKESVMKDSVMKTNQEKFWLSSFGDEYLKRNLTYEDFNLLYKKQTGFNVDKPFQDFFADMDRNMSILEFGCNVGIKLEILKKMGFRNLTGVDINEKAIEIAKKRNPEIKFIHSTIDNLISKDNKYDLVFTSLVLIHQSPEKIITIISKIIELSKKYIFGYEYFSDQLTEIEYRGNTNVLWKQNFVELFQKNQPLLKLIKEKKYYYLKNELVDIGYLFKKDNK